MTLNDLGNFLVEYEARKPVWRWYISLANFISNNLMIKFGLIKQPISNFLPGQRAAAINALYNYALKLGKKYELQGRSIHAELSDNEAFTLYKMVHSMRARENSARKMQYFVGGLFSNAPLASLRDLADTDSLPPTFHALNEIRRALLRDHSFTIAIQRRAAVERIRNTQNNAIEKANDRFGRLVSRVVETSYFVTNNVRRRVENYSPFENFLSLVSAPQYLLKVANFFLSTGSRSENETSRLLRNNHIIIRPLDIPDLTLNPTIETTARIFENLYPPIDLNRIVIEPVDLASTYGTDINGAIAESFETLQPPRTTFNTKRAGKLSEFQVELAKRAVPTDFKLTETNLGGQREYLEKRCLFDFVLQEEVSLDSLNKTQEKIVIVPLSNSTYKFYTQTTFNKYLTHNFSSPNEYKNEDNIECKLDRAFLITPELFEAKINQYKLEKLPKEILQEHVSSMRPC